MKHRLEDHHHDHLRKLGVKHGKKHIFIFPAEYEQHAAAWRRTLPNATDEEIHLKVIGHHASKIQALKHHHKSSMPERLAWAIITLLLILIACTLFAPKAHGQYSKINSIQFQQDGANISGAFFTYPFTINCTVNVTCSIVGGKLVMNASASGGGITTLNTLTDAVQTLSVTNDTNVTGSWSSVSPNHALVLGWTGTLAKARTLGTTVYTDQANTWSASTQEMDQGADGSIVLKMKRFTDASPSGSSFFLIRNAADNTLLFSINQRGRMSIEPDDNVSTADLQITNEAAATSSATTQQGRHITLTNAFWTGSANAFNTWTIGSNALTGSNPQPILTISATQTGGTMPTEKVQVPILNATTGFEINGAASSGKILIGDGTNFVASTPLYPNSASTAGKYIKSTGSSFGTSTGSASGIGTPTACTNQAVTGFTLNSDAAPTSTCASITTSFLSGQVALAKGGTNADLSGTGGTSQVLKQVSTGAAVTVGQLAFTDISGTASAAQLPNPSASTLGGIESLASSASKWINAISTSGVPAATQPAFSDVSGSVAASQMPALTGECTTSAGAVAVTCGSAIAHIVVAGTSTFTTSAVASGACQTTVTTTATGTATTDAIEWAYASAPTAATDGRLVILPYVTANNVNWMRCNDTAASVTPTALVVNWKVLR